jgi:hypothetical protein
MGDSLGRHSRKSNALSLHHCYPTNAEENPQPRLRKSIKRPITVPVSPSSKVKCYPCREVSLSDSLLFHGGDMAEDGAKMGGGMR